MAGIPRIRLDVYFQQVQQCLIIYKMQNASFGEYFTFLPDCFEPEYKNEKKSVYWGRFAETIEKFDQIMDIELKEIRENLQDIFASKAEYLRKFIEYKSSMRLQGQSKAAQTLIVENEKLKKFFQQQLKEVSDIIQLFARDPELLSFLLHKYEDKRRFNFSDFALNITNLFHTHYFLEEKCNKSSQFYSFVSAIFTDWNYDVDNARIRCQSTHNDIVFSFFKNPVAEILVEKMAARFIPELDQSEPFNFDLNAIKTEIQSKKLVQKSMALPQKKSFFDSIRRTLTGSKTDEEIKYAEQAQIVHYHKEALAIQKHRQDRFISILRRSVEIILGQELPNICKLVLQAFREKLVRQIKGKQQDLTKHYCYLIFSMWIFSEFNIKFTMSHDQKGTMTNVDLLNISEILKALTLIFQCAQPSDKIFYKHVIAQYRPRVENFYIKALQLSQISHSSPMGSLLVNYEHSLKIFSLNDLKIFCDLIRTAQKINYQIDLPPETLALKFASGAIYSTKSRVNFRKKDFEAENLYFMLKVDEDKILDQIGNSYLGRQFPLNQMPLLTEALLLSSNLSVEKSLELSKSLEFMKKLSSKQILRHLQKLEQNFKTMKINETKVINEHFMKSFSSRIKDNLLNKCQLSRHKNNICSQLNNLNMIINLYRTRYKSDTFYRNVTHKFVARLRVNVYVGIEQHKLKICTVMPESEKKLQLSSILMSQKPQQVMNSILTRSYKMFDSLEKIMEAVADTDVARRAFTVGKRTQEFNEFFCSLCDISMGKVEQFLNEQKYLQHLNPLKFKGLLQQRLGELLLKFMNIGQIQKDRNFSQVIAQIDQDQFYRKQLSQIQVQAFLFEQAVNEFNQIDFKPSAKEKIDQFDSLVKFIFSVTSLTMSSQKITAQVITPIIQFVILKAQPQNCYKNLYIIECLLGQYNHETAYLITLWTSAVAYLSSLNSNSISNSRLAVSASAVY